VRVAARNATAHCAAINDEADCLARPDCAAYYEGIDCTNPNGTPCHSGDADCTCADFEFASCHQEM
jgi:hypothetical protein